MSWCFPRVLKVQGASRTLSQHESFSRRRCVTVHILKTRRKTRPGRYHAAAPSSAALLTLRTGSRALHATHTAPGTVWHIQRPLRYLLPKPSCRPHESWRWGALLYPQHLSTVPAGGVEPGNIFSRKRKTTKPAQQGALCRFVNTLW